MLSNLSVRSFGRRSMPESNDFVDDELVRLQHVMNKFWKLYLYGQVFGYGDSDISGDI